MQRQNCGDRVLSWRRERGSVERGRGRLKTLNDGQGRPRIGSVSWSLESELQRERLR